MAGPDSPWQTVGGAAGRLAADAQTTFDRVAPPAERDLIRRVLDLPARKKLRLARRLWRDRRVRDTARVPLVLGGLYLALPVHLLPPRLGPLRPWEKLAGLAALLWLILRLTPAPVLREHLDALERPGLLRRVLHREG